MVLIIFNDFLAGSLVQSAEILRILFYLFLRLNLLLTFFDSLNGRLFAWS